MTTIIIILKALVSAEPPLRHRLEFPGAGGEPLDKQRGEPSGRQGGLHLSHHDYRWRT